MASSCAASLFRAGYHPLVSVIPPDSPLSPASTLSSKALGKVPGIRTKAGLWHGYDWRRSKPSLTDAAAWDAAGASVGIRADNFPGVDIDCLDPDLAGEIEAIAQRVLGPAPIRTGRAPKRLLMYCTSKPFRKLTLHVTSRSDGTKHLIEILGSGQYYVLDGLHPATGRPYTWDISPTEWGRERLSEITSQKAMDFLEEVSRQLDARYESTVRGSGVRSRVATEGELLAPSFEALRDAVSAIPNTDAAFPDRMDYIRMGYAIRAAAGPDYEAEGLELFAEWAGRWEEHPDGNAPERVAADWASFLPPFQIGWEWIADQARAFGFNSGVYAFAATADRPSETDDASKLAPKYSDLWLADQVVSRVGDRLRYAPSLKRWYVWTGSVWEMDRTNRVDAIIHEELRSLAADLLRWEKGAPKSQARAQRICSYGTAQGIRGLITSDPLVAVAPEAFDSDPWLLNTPDGIVDLRTGTLQPASPMQLHTKQTAVGPAREADCARWWRFLAEATGDDRELMDYLQRLAGYCLTGLTTEQQFTFVWGPGGTGKSVFLGTLSTLLGDYARPAAMSTFVEARFERHPTELAALQGARLVAASETSSNGRWNEERLKILTGSDLISARFLYGDFFDYQPQFKLLLVGNHKPALQTVDAAIRRRIHLLPFTTKPAQPDGSLAEHLRAEMPGILRWALDGCLAWQLFGLAPPAAITDATANYFEDQDAVGRWMSESVEKDPSCTALTVDLYASWCSWCMTSGESAQTERWLVGSLADRGIARWKHPTTRRSGFKGIQLRPDAVAVTTLGAILEVAP